MKIRTQIIYLCMLLLCFALSSCNNNSARDPKYGGTFRINASDVPDIIFPGQVLKLSEQLIINQVYVGLLKYNPRTVEIESSLAKKWQVEDNQTLYTFYLNNNAFFHSDKCFGKEKTRKIIAEDVKYSMEQIARFHILSQHEISSQLKNIMGSEAILDRAFQTDSSHISGIKIINDTTLVFQLKEPDALFVHFLASTNSLVFPHEAFEAYGFRSTVGSGAYTYSYPEIKGHAMVLVANKKFFRKNKHNEQLPFVDTLRISFITSPPKELLLFDLGELDMVIGISGDYVIDFLDRNIDKLQNNPPYYIMKQTTDSKNTTKYNFFRANVQNVEINSVGYYDLTEIYFKELVQPEIAEN